MSDWRLIVEARVSPEVEDQWNHWYDEEHLPQVASCPGFVSATRMVSRGRGPRLYLSEYVIDDPSTLTTPEFSAARGWYQFEERLEARTRLFEIVTRR